MCLLGDNVQYRLLGDKGCNFIMNLSSGDPQPIISNVALGPSALGQHWKLLASAHHLIKPQYILIYPNISQYIPIPIYPNISQYIPIYSNISQYILIYPNIFQYIPIYPNISQYIPIYSNISQYIPIYPNIYENVFLA